MRNLAKGLPLNDDSEGEPWASLWEGPQHIVFGHDAARGIQIYPFATGLDTGCCYGGELSCVILPEKRYVSVKSHKMYCAPTKSAVAPNTFSSLGLLS